MQSHDHGKQQRIESKIIKSGEHGRIRANLAPSGRDLALSTGTSPGPRCCGTVGGAPLTAQPGSQGEAAGEERTGHGCFRMRVGAKPLQQKLEGPKQRLPPGTRAEGGI